jgi:uncharacterized protein (TIGR03435 family)
MKMAIALAVCAAAYGQGSDFEAGSVKVSAAQNNRSRMRGGPGSGDPGQITYTNVTLAAVLQRAYNLKPYQLTGPDWIGSRRYDFAAKIPEGTTIEQFRSMLQKLVAVRFKLQVHTAQREIAGYELTAGRGAGKLKSSAENPEGIVGQQPASQPKVDANGYPELTAPGLVMMEGLKGKAVVVFVRARAQPVWASTEMLSREFRMPISDKTGLAGSFDFELEYAPQPPGALPGTVEPDDSAANLMTAVSQQLGLRLVPSKIVVDVVVVDGGNPAPAGN